MDDSKKLFLCIVFSGVIFIGCMVLTLSGQATLFVNCFAVDSAGRVYVGLSDSIQVFQNNRYLYTFTDLGDCKQIAKKGTLFSITQDDRLIMDTAGNVYSLDLQGNLLHSWNANNSGMSQNKTFYAANGSTYTLYGQFGYTRIENEDGKVAFQISGTSFVVKIALYVAISLFVPSVSVLILIKLREEFW